MIRQSTIRSYARTPTGEQARRSVEEARTRAQQTAFLSHSHKDSELACRVQAFLKAQGWDVYVDWQDTTMPDRPNPTTADRIKTRIGELTWFLYLATENAGRSRWCPWEIGYADAVKGVDRVVILPTQDERGYSYGAEYLGLYRRITTAEVGGYGLFGPNNRGRLLNEVRANS